MQKKISWHCDWKYFVLDFSLNLDRAKQENKLLCKSLKINVLKNISYFQVIDRRVRELHVETEFLPLETPASFIQDNNFK